ncbi:CBS domain-containing protein [Candidatus Woesearchaeota archaeon]|nr:CBS domain-containing protein [Candidatus Woesearchaeota archaeon]
MANVYLNDFFKKFEFEGLTFDDVLIKPGKSEVVPSDVDLETRLSANIPLNSPITSADMSTVTEADMAIELAKQGGIGFLWKSSIEEQEDWLDEVKYTFNARIENPVTVFESDTLEDAAKKLEHYGNKFSSLVVVDKENKVTGLLTKDKYQFGHGSEIVKDYMVSNPVTSEKDFTVQEAYDFMKTNRIAKLIITEENTPKGLFCYTDVKSIIEGITPLYNRDKKGQLVVGANVGVHDFERAERLLKKKCDALLVGTAHGHSKNVRDTVLELKKQFSSHEFDIIAGNAATYEGAEYLFKAGADAVKVGVGPGSICTTRIVSGAGRAQVSAIHETAKAGEKYGRPVIADGGIRYPGDITKALAAGASSIMTGSLFAGTEESPGDIKTDDKGNLYKEYIGMGSLKAMKGSESSKERYKQEKSSKDKLVPEGIEGGVPYKGSVRNIIFQYLGGLRSGMGYAGAENIKALHENVRFDRISPAGLKESHPHDLKMIKEAPNYEGVK